MSADNVYDRQFLAWAVDRALRFYEVNKLECTADEVTALAEKFCAWIMPAPDAVDSAVELTDEQKAEIAEHEKHLQEFREDKSAGEA